MKNVLSIEKEAIDEAVDDRRYRGFMGTVRMCCECGILVYSTYYKIDTLYICRSCPRFSLCRRLFDRDTFFPKVMKKVEAVQRRF